jgi:signal transduction histidine kinase
MKEISVLFLDDEKNILNAITRMFIDEPYGVVIANSAQEALKILEKEKIKVVLSDQRMPDMSGTQFLHRVKSQYPDIVRIIFTAYADVNVAEQAINVSGVFRFINKPWNPTELKSAVVNAMYHYDLIMENRHLLESLKQKNMELLTINSRLKNLNDVQREFSSTLSHELRTPLASIKAGIDIVMSKTAGPLTEEQLKFLGKSKESVDRLNRLINNILDLAQMESGKKKLSFIAGNINDVVASVVEAQVPVALSKGLEIKTNLDVQVPDIVFDKDKITQVLNNLINNSIKFTQTGSITITSHYQIQGNHVELSIADTGPGINDEDLPKLFEKFQQLGQAHTQVSGTGLGLAICKEIVRQHGGTIEASSKQGYGTTISFILPLEERRRR